MSLLKSHISVWEIHANNFTTDPKSIESFRKRAYTLEFFTVELPSLGKALDAALASGTLDLSGIPFTCRSKTDSRPRFLHEFFKFVFDSDGDLLAQPCARKIQEIRQLTMMFYKFHTPFTPDQERAAYLKFIGTDLRVKTEDWPDTLCEVRKNFQSLLPNDPMDIRPHHSNGATFDKITNVEKRVKRSIYGELMLTFGLSCFFPGDTVAFTQSTEFSALPKISTQRSRVSLVPKDSRGPRIICIEAHEPMMVQKGLQQLLYDHIETNSPAKGYINFTDQRINRNLAHAGSISGKLATIDLKDASDLVSWNLVKEVLPDEWLQALSACRSDTAVIGSYERTMNKFAPMGSALCFPIEAMMFWSICRTITDKVYVYGDDIIVDNSIAGDVIKALESYGLAVNHGKTLTTGNFRESCGAEYYDGHDISYIKCKSYDLSSFVPFLNLVSERFGEQIADELAQDYEARTNVVLFREPTSNRSNARAYVYYTSHCSSSDVFFKRRWNDALQRYEIRSLHEVLEPTDRLGHDRDDHMLYFDWLCMACHVNQPLDYYINREYDSDYISVNFDMIDQLYSTPREVERWATKPKTKFVWGGQNPA